MRTGKWRTAEHRGGLKECLETEQQVEEWIATKLIDTGIYKYYAYDYRIKAHRYLISNMEKNLGLPQRLHCYEEK